MDIVIHTETHVLLSLMAKMFTCEDYADAFRAGRLYANTLGYFRNLEGKGGQGDPREGSVWIDTSTSFLELGGVRMPPGRTSFNSNLTDRVNVVCLYTFHSGLLDPLPDELPPGLKEYVYDQEFFLPKDFGAFAVVITDPEEFMDRVGVALRRHYITDSIVGFRQGLVQYDDLQPCFFQYMNQKISPMEPVFHKRTEFRHQNEYRIAFDTGDDGEDARILEIGDIRDITDPPLRITEFKGRFGVTVVRSA